MDKFFGALTKMLSGILVDNRKYSVNGYMQYIIDFVKTVFSIFFEI